MDRFSDTVLLPSGQLGPLSVNLLEHKRYMLCQILPFN